MLGEGDDERLLQSSYDFVRQLVKSGGGYRESDPAFETAGICTFVLVKHVSWGSARLHSARIGLVRLGHRFSLERAVEGHAASGHLINYVL